MQQAKSMDGFKPCPKCYSEVDVVVVEQKDTFEDSNYFFVNCQSCGEGTPTAFPSMEKLQFEWNQKVESSRAAANI